MWQAWMWHLKIKKRAHTLGLDHSALPTDVMHNGLDHVIHSLMPPSFHAEQINSMNNAIRRSKFN
jgi:hypothetical protein